MTAPATPAQSGFVERVVRMCRDAGALYGVSYVAGERKVEEIEAQLTSHAAVMDALVGALEELLDGTGDMTAEIVESARAALALAKGQQR